MRKSKKSPRQQTKAEFREEIRKGTDRAIRERTARLKLNAREKKVLAVVKKTTEPVSIDQIVTETKLEAQEAIATLLVLEVRRLVKQLPGKLFIQSESTSPAPVDEKPAKTTEAVEKAPKLKGKKAEKTEKAEKAPKHSIVPEGGEIIINEQVGVHFRTFPENAPKEGGIITIQFNDGTSDVKLFLNVKSVISTKDGNRLVQAFCEKGSGDYKFMIKGAKAVWHHALTRPTKPTTKK